jgi:hypothetical protein
MVEDKMVLVVIRPIEVGEQLFDCFCEVSKQEREKMLTGYTITCGCIA